MDTRAHRDISKHQAQLKKLRSTASRMMRLYLNNPRKYVGKLVELSHLMGFHEDAIRAIKFQSKLKKRGKQ